MIVEPGLYPRSFADYDQIEAVNQSSLVPISISPLHYIAANRLQRKVTQPMRLGDLAHCAILEPDKLGLRYAVWLGSTKTGNTAFTGKEFETFKANAEEHGKRVIKQADLDDAIAMAAAVRRSELAQRYMRRGRPEMIIVWRDEATGLLCKGRIDMLSSAIEGADIGVELKTSASIAQRPFEQRFAQAQYDVQAAFYADGYRAVTGRTLSMKCVAVENESPFDVGVYDLTEVIDTGREYYREMLATLKRCIDTNEWPGQFDAERTLRLPMWRTEPYAQDEEESADADLDYGGP